MKILITGGTGLVGSAIKNISHHYNYEFFFIASKDCDLTKFDETNTLFKKIKPNYVIHLAAYVGGLYRNMAEKVQMYEKNIEINLNVLKCCHRYNVQKVISCLSTCIFPNNTTYPINESMLHLGPPHYSNDAYAYSKRMLEIHSKTYQTQFGKDFICVIPTNIYGPNDNFSLENGHVIPALIHNCYLSKKNKKKFTVKGTGKPLRQFIYSEDLAKLLMIILEKYNKKESIILSPIEEHSIQEIAQEISECFNYKKIVFDNSFSDGQHRKTADNSELLKLIGNNFKFTNIKIGIQKTVKWFKNNYDTVRK